MQVLNRWQVGSAWVVIAGITAGAIALPTNRDRSQTSRNYGLFPLPIWEMK